MFSLFFHPFWFSWATYWALEGAAPWCSLFISLGLLLQGHCKQNLMNKYVHTLKYQLRKMDTSCYFFWKVFSFLMHLYLSMLAGKSLPEDSCIRTSIENRNFRWVTTNFRGYLLFDDFQFLIIMFTCRLLLTSFPFTIVCLRRQDNDGLLAPSLHNGGPALSPILLSLQMMVYCPSRHFVPHNKQKSCKQISHTLV